MTDSPRIELTTEEDLINYGYLQPATLDHWKTIGYDIEKAREAKKRFEANPNDEEAEEILVNFRLAEALIKSLEINLKLPETGILSRFIQNYKQKYYTRDCLRYHTPNFCADESLQCNHSNIFRQAFDLLSADDKNRYATTSFYNLINSDDMDTMVFLLPYIQDKQYLATGLTRAAENGNMNLVQLLQPLLQDEEYEEAYDDAFASAAENGYISIVENLLSSEYVSNLGIGEGLLEAIRNKYIAITELIIDHERGYDALLEIFLDVMNDDSAEDINLLVHYPGIINLVIDTYLKQNNWDSIRKLATYTGAFSTSDEDLLVWAAAVNSLNLVKVLLDKGIDLHYDNDSTMASAVHYKHWNIVNYLESLQ